MAGTFELFTDFHSHTRFRLLSADGAVLAVSQAYPDTIAAAAAITDVRECAGTGLIEDHSTAAPSAVGVPRPYRRNMPRARDAHRSVKPAPPRRPSNTDLWLQDLILDCSDIGQFLAGLAAVAAEKLSRVGTEMSCGITIRQPKRPVALAGSELGARSMDELHNILGEGPGLTAMADQRTVLVADLDDEQPWPRFIGSAARHGIRSILSIPLSAEGETKGALTLYARHRNAFSLEYIDAAEAFAAQASRALRRVLQNTDLTESNRNLTAALAHRAAIDTALGVAVGQNRCDHDDAFRILERASSKKREAP